MKRLIASLLLGTVLVPATGLSAQPPALGAVEVKQGDASTIPPAVLAALAGAERLDIYNIGREVLDTNVIRADKIVFGSGSIAQIDNYDWPFIILAADEILFADAEGGAQIIRGLSAGARQPDAPPKAAGYPGNAGRNGKDGNNGTPGRTGLQGLPGQTLSIPDIWIFARRIGAQGTDNPTLTKVNLQFWLDGIKGSEGSRGGEGGDGQNGGDGRKGRANMGICSKGPGDGGNGGRAGTGGEGGTGGAGGDGGDVYFVGPSSVIDVLKYASISNLAATGGSGGAAGAAGAPGTGGSRGARPGTCDGNHDGGRGGDASPHDMGVGRVGPDGRKGQTTAYLVNALDDVLK